MPSDTTLERAVEWVSSHGYATGFADTIEDLLEELHRQLLPEGFVCSANAKRDARDAAICAAYGAGATLQQAGRPHGITDEAVRQILIRRGLKTRGRARR